jgi:hypothetical protein
MTDRNDIPEHKKLNASLRIPFLSGLEKMALIDYLASHEEDIEFGVNDFGDLATLFSALFGFPAGYRVDQDLQSDQ